MWETGFAVGLSGPAITGPGRRATPRSGEVSPNPGGSVEESGKLAEVRRTGRETMVDADAGADESPAPPEKPLTPNEWETGTPRRIGGSSPKPRCQYGRGVGPEEATPKGVRLRRIGAACEGLGPSTRSRPPGTGRESTPEAPDPNGSSA